MATTPYISGILPQWLPQPMPRPPPMGLQVSRQAAVNTVAIPTYYGWAMVPLEFSHKLDGDAQSHSVDLIAVHGGATWTVRVTFLGQPCPPGQETAEEVDWGKRWLDFEHLCCAIRFQHIARLDNKVTEILISPPWMPHLAQSEQLSLNYSPADDSDYVAFQTHHLRYHVQECRDYYRHLPAPTDCLVPIDLDFMDLIDGIPPYPHLTIAWITDSSQRMVTGEPLSAEPAWYMYKSVDKTSVPQYDLILAQEARNLQRLMFCPQIVRLLRTVESTSPYTTRPGHSEPKVFRGILIDHHPNGTLHDELQNPQARVRQRSLSWALDVSRAVMFMHEMKITHMNLQPKHVVMSRDWDAIVIDVSGIGGTPGEWLLPELVGVEDWSSVPFDVRQRSDVWALGLMMAAMADAIEGRESQEVRLVLLGIAQAIKRESGRTSVAGIAHQLHNVLHGQQPVVTNTVRGWYVESLTGPA